jgi:hypothetical protein
MALWSGYVLGSHGGASGGVSRMPFQHIHAKAEITDHGWLLMLNGQGEPDCRC